MSRSDITPSTPNPNGNELNPTEEETYNSLRLARDLIRVLDAESEALMSHISAADKQGRTEETSG
jgi:hypothetical protein